MFKRLREIIRYFWAPTTTGRIQSKNFIKASIFPIDIIVEYVFKFFDWLIGYDQIYQDFIDKEGPVWEPSQSDSFESYYKDYSIYTTNKPMIIQDHGDKPKVNISSVKEDATVSYEKISYSPSKLNNPEEQFKKNIHTMEVLAMNETQNELNQSEYITNNEQFKTIEDINVLFGETSNTNIINNDNKSFYLENLEVNKKLFNNIIYQQQAQTLCSPGEFKDYSSFVNENIMNWKDVVLHIKGWEEHMDGMHVLTTQLMYRGYNITEMREPLSKYLASIGYSNKYIVNAIGAHFDEVKDDIIMFMRYRHLFTENDITIEENLPDKQRQIVSKYFEKLLLEEITEKQFKRLLLTKMQNLGYSHNYIKYTLLKFLNKLKEIKEN
jgi:hypothetical protein